MAKKYFDYSKRKEILINYGDLKSIINAERKKMKGGKK